MKLKKTNLTNLKEFPKNILNTYFSKEIYNESKNIYREIEGRTVKQK